jgi:hypothetical protein
MTWELALLARLLLTTAALLPWLLLSRLAGLLSATALLATLTTLLARFVVRVHDCSFVYLSQSITRSCHLSSVSG